MKTLLQRYATCQRLIHEFTLKSGRVSPYFFNASAFSSGRQLQILGRCYRDAITDRGIEFDGLFGPAYKGIPLASSVAVAFADEGKDYPVKDGDVIHFRFNV